MVNVGGSEKLSRWACNMIDMVVGVAVASGQWLASMESEPT